jgi:hypothetical protein
MTLELHPQLFFLDSFQIGSHIFVWCRTQTKVLLPTASHVAQIIGMYNHASLIDWDGDLVIFFPRLFWDMYYVVWCTITASVLSVGKPFLLVIIPLAIWYNNYLHSVCIELGIINHLKMSYSVQEDMHKLYANSLSFYRVDLSRLRFWNL